MKLETYRAACQQAKEELHDILAEIDNLRTRKEQIEKMIAVLEPLAGPEGIGAQIDRALDRRVEVAPVREFREFSRPRSEDAHQEEEHLPVSVVKTEHKEQEEFVEQMGTAVVEEPITANAEAEEEPAFQAEEVSTDPIKRRIANALRHRVVVRDNHEFNQAFSGGITRW